MILNFEWEVDSIASYFYIYNCSILANFAQNIKLWTPNINLHLVFCEKDKSILKNQRGPQKKRRDIYRTEVNSLSK